MTTVDVEVDQGVQELINRRARDISTIILRFGNDQNEVESNVRRYVNTELLNGQDARDYILGLGAMREEAIARASEFITDYEAQNGKLNSAYNFAIEKDMFFYAAISIGTIGIGSGLIILMPVGIGIYTVLPSLAERFFNRKAKQARVNFEQRIRSAFYEALERGHASK